MSQHMGDRLKILREKAGLTREELGKRAKVTGAYIGRLERQEANYRNPTIGNIQAIAKALDVHPSLLLFGKVLEPTLKIKKSDQQAMVLNEEEKELLLSYRKIKSKKGRDIVRGMVGSAVGKGRG